MAQKVGESVNNLISKVDAMFDNKDGIKTNVTINLGMQTYVNLMLTIVVSIGIVLVANSIIKRMFS